MDVPGIIRSLTQTGLQVSQIRVETFARQTPKNALITAATATTLWLLLVGTAPLYLSLPWVMLHLMGAGFLYYRWLRVGSKPRTRPVSRKFLRRARLWAGLSGGLWGSTIAFFPSATPALQIMILVVVASMAIGGATTLAALPGAAALFIALSLVPAVVYFALQSDIVFAGISILVLVLGVGMLFSARTVYDTLVRETDAHAQSDALMRQFKEERQEWLDLSDIADGYALFDEDNHLVMWNRSYGRILGIDETELVRGTDLQDILTGSIQPSPISENLGKDWTAFHQLATGKDSAAVVHLADSRWIQVRRNSTAGNRTAFVYSDVTKLKEMERAARDAYGRLEDAVFSMDEGVMLYDADGKVVLSNERFFEIFPGTRAVFEQGRARPDAVREAVQLGLMGDQATDVDTAVERILHRHTQADGNPEIVGTRHGSTIQIRNFPTREGGMMTVATDVTDTIRREEATRQSRDQMRLVTDSLPVLIAYVGSDSRYRFANATCARWFGARPDEIVGRAAEELLGPEATKLHRAIQSVSITGEANHLETQFTYPDGQTRDIKATYVPHMSPEGVLVGHFELIEDLTEQKEIAAVASRSVGQFSALVDNSPNAILFADEAGTIRSANRRTEEFFASEQSGSVVGMTLDQIGLDSRGTALETVLRSDGPHQFERNYIRGDGDGDARRIATSLFAVRDRDGDLMGVGAINTDVTAQRAAEVQLRQAQKMDAIGQLTGGIAHDFNNMLTVIIGNLELLQTKKQADDDAERFLSSSIGAARRGTSFTQRLLAFSRKQALRPEALLVEPLFAELVQLMKRTLGETIEIITKVESAPAVQVDRNQLENALLNLAVNARDAMPEGGKLWLRARPVDRNGSPLVLIEVIDEGNGMPPDVLSRAIEPFYTTKSTGAGTGLGLSMVYGFAGQSGGQFEIDSKEGVGTTVRLLLPATSSAAVIQPPREIPSDALPEGNEKLLVVEDDPDVRDIAVAALSSLGYHVTQAGDGPTAVALAASLTDLDMLVTDVVLPRGMSGPDVSVEIRRLFPRAKVLFMSGYSGDALLEHGALRPGIELLSKPYSKTALAKRVRSILDQA